MAAWSAAETCRISTLIMSANSVRGSRGSFGKKIIERNHEARFLQSAACCLNQIISGNALQNFSHRLVRRQQRHVILEQNFPSAVDEGPLSAAKNIQPQQN